MTDSQILEIWGACAISPEILGFARQIEQAAIKHEREACAKECDEMPQRLGIHCARAIRARSEGS